MLTLSQTVRALRGLLLTALLSACASPPPAAPPVSVESGPPGTFPSARYSALPTGTVLRVSSSTLSLHVYRAGRLQHLGHNHVITSHALQGLIYLPPDGTDITTAHADLYLGVASLVVDDPAARANAGAEFAAAVPAADRDATRNNLLGPRLLDAHHHPYLEIAVAARTDTQAALQITLKGNTYAVDAPVTWHRTDTGLWASSTFTVQHEAIGLTPFSVLGGALAVADEIAVNLRLEAIFTQI